MLTTNDDITRIVYKEVFKKIQHTNVDVFLCGGASDAKYTSYRDRLRYRIEKDNGLAIFYPEELFAEMLSRKKYDLLTLEQFLADNSDLIVIVCESPGSFAELGAFANNENTVDKVVVLLKTKYKNQKSFIVQGPVQYIKDKSKDSVIYFNRDLDELEKQLYKLLKKKFRNNRYGSTSKRRKDINLISGQYYFIILLLYFYKKINVVELKSCIKKIYHECNFDEQYFRLIYFSAIKRLYNDGFLVKNLDKEESYYELSLSGHKYAQGLIRNTDIDRRDKTTNGIRLDILKTQFY